MDDIRGSLSKMKKKAKHLLTGKKRKQDGTGANPGEEGADSTSALPQPESHVVVDESCDEEGDKADVAGEPVFSMGQPPQPDGPESVPARGGDVNREGEGADVDGGEASQMNSHPHPGVEVAVGSGYGGEPQGVYPSPSTPSILHGGKPDST